MSADLVDEIRTALRDAAVPSRATGQQAYMKSAMPFLGVRVPEVRAAARAASTGRDPADLRRSARRLWDEASHREERYAALALLGTAALRGDPATMPLVEHMVRTGRWWDYTDDLAHRVAEHLDRRPDATAALVRTWAVDPDMWMRRLAILAQLGRRERTDPTLLSDAMRPNVDDPDFFVRKAVGWALRDFARTDPEWVRAFVSRHPLSTLSRREALKHLD